MIPSLQSLMEEALEEARKAAESGEAPIGAIIIKDGEIIARAHNEVEALRDATAHAEILALRRASERLGTWRLDGTSLFVTLEPCTMCIGAMLLSRIGSLYFGAFDPRQGAVGSLFDLSNHPGLPHSFSVYPEVLAEESAKLLRKFFSGLR